MAGTCIKQQYQSNFYALSANNDSINNINNSNDHNDDNDDNNTQVVIPKACKIETIKEYFEADVFIQTRWWQPVLDSTEVNFVHLASANNNTYNNNNRPALSW